MRCMGPTGGAGGGISLDLCDLGLEMGLGS